MLRAWPKNIDSKTIVVKWKKSKFLIFITGFFSVMIPLIIWVQYSNNFDKILESIGTVRLIFILFFWLIVICSFIKCIRNYINPIVRFIANHEGIFMNITLKQSDAFFVPWIDIEDIKEIEIKEGLGRESYRDTAVSITLSGRSLTNLPKVLRGVPGSGKHSIAFAAKTMDTDLDEVLKILNNMKSNYKSL